MGAGPVQRGLLGRNCGKKNVGDAGIPRHEMKKTFIFKIMSILLGICAGIVAGELLARTIMPRPLYYPRIRMEKVKIRVHQGVELWDVRDDEMEGMARKATEQKDSYRIVGLGDSIMFGANINKKDTYINRLGSEMEKITGRKTQVVDLSQPGYNLRQEAALFAMLGVQTKPNLVIIHAWEDDLAEYLVVGGIIYGSNIYSETGIVRTIPLPSVVNEFFILRSRLYQYLSFLALKSRQNNKKENMGNRPTCSQLLDSFYKNAQKSNARILILLSPALVDGKIQPFDRTPTKQSLYFAITGWAKSRGVDVIDLTEVMAGVDGKTIRVDEVHFNKKGHDMILKILADYIPARYLKQAPAVPSRGL